ncbi:DUF2125 domain-containing protein [Rhodoblastus sp.]|jgi:hypothetical protein|uniref:DUF2125 domain-containing protein n=1 Tax=Rhodoblastus sp. TaxID=1962975 RepID=UPI0025E06A9A|nr:DUF2125 domain-containing protein [Rhodoblastus sp.]
MARYRRPLLIGLVVLLCLALGEFWLYSAHRLASYMDKRALGGVSLADLCRTSDIGGFPFRLKLSCAEFTAPVRIGDEVVLFGAEEAHGEASLFSPNHILLTLSSPLVVQKSGGGPLAKLRHDGMTLDIAWSLSGLSEARLDMKALDWRPETPQAGLAFNLQSLTAKATPQVGEGPGVMRFELTGEGLNLPALQALLQKNDLGRFTLSGKVSPVPGAAADFRAAVEDWRKKSGAVVIDQLQWQAGDLNLKIDGALSLDDAHRPVGKLNVTAEGAGPLLARLGVPVAATQVNAVLGALLGKPPAQGAKADTLSLPLTLANGQAYLGPVRLPATVPPLY